jgi:hypothetical protein
VAIADGLDARIETVRNVAAGIRSKYHPGAMIDRAKFAVREGIASID